MLASRKPFGHRGFVSWKNRPAKNRGFRPAPERLDVGGEPVWINDGVIIGPHDIFPLRGIEGSIARTRNPPLRLGFAPNWQTSCVRRNDVVGVIGAAIVDDQNLPSKIIWYAHPRQGFQVPSQRFRAVQRADCNCGEHGPRCPTIGGRTVLKSTIPDGERLRWASMKCRSSVNSPSAGGACLCASAWSQNKW